MKKLQRQYRESIIALFRALETISRFLTPDSTEVHQTVRRIAHSLHTAGVTYDLPEITKEAAWLEEADSVEMLQHLDILLSKLDKFTHSEESDKLGVLIIEDDPTTSKLVKTLLETPNREVYIVDSTAEGFSYLIDNDVELVILDLKLPDGDGRDFLVRMRAFPGMAMIPVIVLTSTEEVRVEIECLALGADLFIRKPFDPEILSVAVASLLQRAADFSRQARQDLLTGLPNRSAFFDIYERAASFATRLKESLSIGILDLDHFKNVNDTHGHAVGDEVLRRTAAVIVDSLRKSDQIARWGGEEFVVLFPHTTPDGAKIALDKALMAMGEEKFDGADNKQFSVSFSAGVTEVGRGVLVQEAVAEADRLLYVAKSEGRNRILCGPNSDNRDSASA